MNEQLYSLTGIITLALRLVVGWTYFSAFLRRVVLENKLLPDAPGYIGEKFNHFLPNSIGIKPIIEYLVTNPTYLWWAMIIFTVIEGIVGLAFMLGFFTRLMSIGVLMLAAGILLGSGWLGTTCLDEWQIGILGVAAGFTVFLAGGGSVSLDHVLLPKFTFLQNQHWLVWLTSGPLAISMKTVSLISVVGAVAIFTLSLYTNQVFHHGVWGPLHNKSVKPVIEISDARLADNQLAFTVYRVEGVDVYGSFLIGITLKDNNGHTILDKKAEDLAQFPINHIQNQYIAKVKPGKHSLVIPLGAKAQITMNDAELSQLPKGTYTLILTDITGTTWEEIVSANV